MNRKLPILLIVALLAASIVLSACSGTAGASLAGTSWKLASYGAADNPTPAAADVETSLEFSSDGKVSGNMGCNGFGGDYELKNGKIVFGSIVSTMMACEEPRMTQETTAFQVMSGTVEYELSGNTLTIYGPDKTNVLILVQE